MRTPPGQSSPCDSTGARIPRSSESALAHALVPPPTPEAGESANGADRPPAISNLPVQRCTIRTSAMIHHLLFFVRLEHACRQRGEQFPDLFVVVHCQLSPGYWVSSVSRSRSSAR